MREGVGDSIRDGEVRPGEQLPSERELARRYGVSYMTARRAISEMVEVGLLERRGREGTFVRSYGAAMLATRTLHLMCPDFDTADIKTFLRLGARAGELEGWKTHVIRLSPSNERAAARALEEGDLALVLAAGPELEGVLGSALKAAEGRAVLIGNRLDNEGVPSVLADDSQAIRLAVHHLQDAGHIHIALVSDHPNHAVDRVQIGAWRAALAHEAPQDLIVVNTPRHESATEQTMERVKTYFEHGGKATAIITLADEMALAAMAAVRATGRQVPQDVSLINSGNSPLLGVAHPGVTCIDVHIAEHIEQGLKFLRAAIENESDPFDRLRFVEPHMVERESVAPPSSAQ
ncbi:arabinose metabolism transcriptional repressor [Abditibacteriota bacterium]|nr:arabinose metabolism transcriptional repressor [Abditibacteriota bacterium]